MAWRTDSSSAGLNERIRTPRPSEGDPAPTEPVRGSAPESAAPSGRPHDPYASLKSAVHAAVIEKLGPELFAAEASGEVERRVEQSIAEELGRQAAPLARAERARIVKELRDDILGYGPLEPLLNDDEISEVMVNAADEVYVERSGRLEEVQVPFVDDAHVMRIVDKIVSQVGRRVDEASPMVDARLPDGSRINAIIPPLAISGPTLTIRKFSKDPLTVDDLIRFGSLTPKAAEFLAACVEGQLNILIAGGTGSGKTTLLNVLSSFIPTGERIVTIEDAAELQLQQRHVVSLEARPANIEGKGEVRIRELVRNSLRMRPDRIVVGEVRGPETLDMLQAMNTGHEGSLTTIHANSPRDALSRLETLVLTAGVDLPLRSIREQIASAFDLLIQQARLVDGSRRVTHITELIGMESDVVTLQDIFVARPADADGGGLLLPLRSTGLQPHFLEKLAGTGVHLPASFFEPEPETGTQAPVSFGGYQPRRG